MSLLVKDDFESIINLHNEMSVKKSLEKDKWISKLYLKKLLKYLGNKVNIVKAQFTLGEPLAENTVLLGWDTICYRKRLKIILTKIIHRIINLLI